MPDILTRLNALAARLSPLSASSRPSPGREEALICEDAIAEIERLRAACEASWRIGHQVYHNANAHGAPLDWASVRKLLAEALGKTV